jgi:macrolide transport system ATP-binding/permease protein
MLCVRYIESQPYEIKGVDVGVLAGAVLTLVAAALFAGLIPARRAASIEPAQALRTE